MTSLAAVRKKLCERKKRLSDELNAVEEALELLAKNEEIVDELAKVGLLHSPSRRRKAICPICKESVQVCNDGDLTYSHGQCGTVDLVTGETLENGWIEKNLSAPDDSASR